MLETGRGGGETQEETPGPWWRWWYPQKMLPPPPNEFCKYISTNLQGILSNSITESLLLNF